MKLPAIATDYTPNRYFSIPHPSPARPRLEAATPPRPPDARLSSRRRGTLATEEHQHAFSPAGGRRPLPRRGLAPTSPSQHWPPSPNPTLKKEKKGAQDLHPPTLALEECFLNDGRRPKLCSDEVKAPPASSPNCARYSIPISMV